MVLFPHRPDVLTQCLRRLLVHVEVEAPVAEDAEPPLPRARPPVQFDERPLALGAREAGHRLRHLAGGEEDAAAGEVHPQVGLRKDRELNNYSVLLYTVYCKCAKKLIQPIKP